MKWLKQKIRENLEVNQWNQLLIIIKLLSNNKKKVSNNISNNQIIKKYNKLNKDK